MTLVSIQPRLNTEERAMIWRMVFLFICRILPMKEVIRMKGNMIIFI